MKDLKMSLKEFGTAVAIFIMLIIAIMTNVTIWNTEVDTFKIIVSIINLVFETGVLGYILKKKFLS